VVDSLDDVFASQIRPELGHIQTEGGCRLVEPLGKFIGSKTTPRLLVGKEEVVHLPELALFPRRNRGLGRQGSLVVDRFEREITKDKADCFWILLLELRQHGRKISTGRSLKIAILDDGHRSFFRSHGIIIIADRWKEGRLFCVRGGFNIDFLAEALDERGYRSESGEAGRARDWTSGSAGCQQQNDRKEKN